LSRFPNQIANHHPGFEKYYRYYEGKLNGGKEVLYVIKDPSKVSTDSTTSASSEADEGDDDA